MTLVDLIIKIFLTGLILASLLFPAHRYKEDLNITKGMMIIESYSHKAKTLSRTTLEEYRVVISTRKIEIQNDRYDKEKNEYKTEVLNRRIIDVSNVDMHNIYDEIYSKIYDESYKKKNNVKVEKKNKDIIITWKGVE